jgi:hypothetical protein
MVARRGGTPGTLWLAVQVIGVAGRLVPHELRADWQEEWRAELWHLYHSLGERGHLSARDRAAFVVRSFGSLFDALQLRLGDAQLWRESFAAVATHWRQHARPVAIALLFLSVGVAADALLIAFGHIMVDVPHSAWSSLGSETRLAILGVAIVCGISLIVASAAAAAQLLGSADPAAYRDRSVCVAETLLAAGVTGWLGRWFAAFWMRTAIPPHWGERLASVDLAAAVTNGWVVSWICGLTVLTVLRVRRRGGTARRPA